MDKVQQYSGHWKIWDDDIAYPGELVLYEETGFIYLHLHRPNHKINFKPDFPMHGRIPYIQGELFNGEKLLLYDCFTRIDKGLLFNPANSIIQVKYIFKGLEISSEKELVFSGAEFCFENIVAWSNMFREEFDLYELNTSTYKWNYKDHVSFRVDNGLELSFYPFLKNTNITRRYYDELITIAKTILTVLHYPKPVKWETVMHDALCIQYLIGVGTRNFIGITKTSFFHNSLVHKTLNNDQNNPNKYKEKEVIIGQEKFPLGQNIDPLHFLFNLDDVEKNDRLDKWYRNFDLLKPVLDLYFTAYTRKAGTPEMLFINLVQALETFHARIFKNKIVPESKRTEDCFIGHQRDSNACELYEHMLNRVREMRERNKSRIVLLDRLIYLIYADGVLPFWPETNSLFNYAKKVVDTRNYYTHYDLAKKDKAFSTSELIRINDHLMALLEYHILALTGFNEEEIKKKLMERIYWIDFAYKATNKTIDRRSR